MPFLVAEKRSGPYGAGIKMRSMRGFDSLTGALTYYRALPDKRRRSSRIWELSHDSMRILTKKEYQ